MLLTCVSKSWSHSDFSFSNISLCVDKVSLIHCLMPIDLVCPRLRIVTSVLCYWDIPPPPCLFLLKNVASNFDGFYSTEIRVG